MYEDKRLEEYLASMFEEVGTVEFYREVFPKGELERWRHPEDEKPNGILTSISLTKTFKKEVRGKEIEQPCRHNRIIPDDLQIIEDEVSSDEDFVIIAPISYYGKNRTSENAVFLYAIAIDLDYIRRDKDGDPIGLRNLIDQIEKGYLARPSFIVSSGKGLHLYFLLSEPIHLRRRNVAELKKMRDEMVRKFWNGYITDDSDNPQYESIYQGFRAVGSITKVGTRCRAFKFDDEVKRYTIEELNAFLPFKETHANITEYYQRPKNRMSYEQAEKKFPEWAKTHPKGVYQGNKKQGFYVENWYNSYFKRIHGEIVIGHRYNAIKHLCVLARKGGISFEQLEADAWSVFDLFNSLKGADENPFTEIEMIEALEYYYFNDAFSITKEWTEKQTGMKFPTTKRNYRSREKHLAGARAIRDINNDNWREGAGRPPQHKEAVEQYFEEHPNASVTDCASDLNIARSTVYRWRKK